MLIKIRQGWEIPESAVTPEALVFGRRDFLKAAGGAAIAQAEAWRTGDAMELWSGARKVMAWASAAEAGWAGPGAGSRLRRA